MIKIILLIIGLISNLSASYRAFCAHKEQRHQEQAIARGNYASAMGGSLNLTQADICFSSRSGASGSATFTSIGGSTTLAFNTKIRGGLQFRSSFEEPSSHNIAALANRGINHSALAVSLELNPARTLHAAAQSAIDSYQNIQQKPINSAAVTNLFKSLNSICDLTTDKAAEDDDKHSSEIDSNGVHRVSTSDSNKFSDYEKNTAKDNFLRFITKKPEPTVGDAINALRSTAAERTSAQRTFIYKLDNHVNTSLEFAAKRRGRTLSPASRRMVTERSTSHFIRSHAAKTTLEIVTTNNALHAASYLPGIAGPIAEVSNTILDVVQGNLSIQEAIVQTAAVAVGAGKSLHGFNCLQEAYRSHIVQPALSCASNASSYQSNRSIPASKPQQKSWEAEDVERFRRNYLLTEQNNILKLPSPESLGHTPYAGGYQRSFITTQPETYYRVYSGDSTTGKFLTKVAPHSSAYAQESLSLPSWNKAEFIQEVLVPSGIRLQRSRAIEAFEGRKGGAEQFEVLLKEDLNKLTFKPSIPLS